MRKFITAVAASLMVATAAPALARDTAPAAPVSSAETPAPKAETRYCVDATTTGTRVPKRICKTRADWIAEQNFDPLNPKG